MTRRMRQLKINKSITNRDSQSLEKYLNEIGKYPLLTASEEVELAQRIRQGDDGAFERMCTSNLRFVVSVAKQYQNQGLSLPDLINDGNLGLIKAAERFDETRGFKFISYAVWWIRQQILQSLAEQARIVRLPLNKIGSINRLKKSISKFEQEEEREPTDDELAQITGMTIEEVALSLRNLKRHISIEAPLQDTEGSGTLLDIMKDTDLPDPAQALVTDDIRLDIERSLDTLSTREANVLRLYFGLVKGKSPLTLEEIGQGFDLTRERVRQIKDKAIGRLKHTSRGRLLTAYRSFVAKS